MAESGFDSSLRGLNIGVTVLNSKIN
jgi:hypothetical protein